LIPPRTRLKVNGLHKQDDRWHVQLNEIAESSDE
ncbi:type III effector, partial [Pseudomonas syringae pv. tagetis]